MAFRRAHAASEDTGLQLSPAYPLSLGPTPYQGVWGKLSCCRRDWCSSCSIQPSNSLEKFQLTPQMYWSGTWHLVSSTHHSIGQSKQYLRHLTSPLSFRTFTIFQILSMKISLETSTHSQESEKEPSSLRLAYKPSKEMVSSKLAHTNPSSEE